MLHCYHRTAYPQLPCRKIQVLPLQAANLSTAKPCRQLCIEKIMPDSVILQLCHKPFHLFFGQNLLWRIVRFWDSRTICWIVYYKMFPHSRIHGLMKHHMDSANRTIRKLKPHGIMLIDPAIFLQSVVHLLNIFCGNIRNSHHTQAWLDIVFDHAFIAG